jgi:hypothetical protein
MKGGIMRYFEMKEFACKCCGQLPPSAEQNLQALVEHVLDPARERLGMPITVNSGYRCLAHNKAVGGVKNSQHLKGEAADITCADNKRLAEIIEQLGNFDQLIVYPTFLHVSYKRQGVNRESITGARPH